MRPRVVFLRRSSPTEPVGLECLAVQRHCHLLTSRQTLRLRPNESPKSAKDLFQYYSKRFQTMVMSRRAKEVYEFGPFRIDVAERLLTREGQNVPLTPKAFDTLLLLVENRGH